MLGDVGDPESVRAVSDEHSLDVIGEHGRLATATVSPATPVNALQSRLSHQPLDLPATDPQIPPENQLGVHPTGPIGSANVLMDSGDHR